MLTLVAMATGCGEGDRLMLQLPSAFTEPPVAILAVADTGDVIEPREVIATTVLGVLEPTEVCLSVSLRELDRVYALDLSDWGNAPFSDDICDLDSEGCCPTSQERICDFAYSGMRAAAASVGDLAWEPANPAEVCF